MTTREELIRACREAADLCSQLTYSGEIGAGHARQLYEVANRCRYAVARAEAEDAADAPAAGGEVLFADELGGEGG
jgi:hypothetical protein